MKNLLNFFILFYIGFALALLNCDFRVNFIRPVFQSKPSAKEPKVEPNDYFAKQKLYPHGKFSHDYYLDALRQAEILHRNSPPFKASWELAGPLNIGGRITDLAIHPSTPNTWYVGAASGGIYKTTNGGGSWANVFTQAPVISIGALAIDPNNQNIIYAGTGEANSSSYSFIGNGMYKSINAGNSWQHIGLTYSAYIGRIVVDYSNSQRVFVAATGTLFTPNEQRGIYRSNNGGASWDRVLFISDSTAGIDIVQHPTQPNTLYAAMWERMRGLTYRRSHGITSGIYKTANGGDSWVLVNSGLPPANQIGRIGLAIARTNPQMLYAFIDRLVGASNVASVYRTNNGGENWNQTNDSRLVNTNRNFGWYFGQIRVDPQNENRFWVHGVELWRSNDGGASYTELAGYGNINHIYVDQHAMYIDPNTGFIVHGNDGGLYTSTNFGDTWSHINNLPLTQFYAIEVDYLNPHRIYGGTQDNNTIRTLTGALNDWQRILGGDGFYTVVDYTNSNIIYAESQWGGLSRSTSGGASFQNIANWSGDRTNWSSPFVIHPTNPHILFFGTYRIRKTVNQGTSWSVISGDLTHQMAASGFSTITTIDISALEPQRLITGSDDGRVHITTNGGITWTDISAGLPQRWITRVAFDPFNADIFYATVSGFRWDEQHPYVFRKTLQEPSWKSISGNLPGLPVNVITADPGKQDRLFVGTDAGVFYTENGGGLWLGLSNGMPNVPVTSMKIHHPTRSLIIGTYGCSAYRLRLDLLSGADELSKPSLAQGVLLNSVYPNPFNPDAEKGKLGIEFYLAFKTDTRLVVMDLNGNHISTIFVGILNGGSHKFEWDGYTNGDNPSYPGVYLLSLSTGLGVTQQKFIVVR